MAYKYTLIQFLSTLLLIPMLPVVCFRNKSFIYFYHWKQGMLCVGKCQ